MRGRVALARVAIVGESGGVVYSTEGKRLCGRKLERGILYSAALSVATNVQQWATAQRD